MELSSTYCQAGWWLFWGAAPCFVAPHLRRLSTSGELSRFGRLLSVMAAVVGAVILCGNELRLVNVGAGKQF